MKEILAELQPTATIYADILSKILKVEITIVDENLHRIAGSNRSMIHQAEQRMDVTSIGGIMSRTIRTGEVQIIENPKENEACDGCTEKKRCMEKYHMSAPIMVEGESKGALAFIASTKQAKNRMMKNKQLYLEFLVQFTNLMALKVQETITKTYNLSYLELLNSIVDYADVGVLVFGSDGRLTMINSIARRLLHMTDLLPIEVEFAFLNQERGLAEYMLQVKEQSYRLFGKLQHVYLENYSDIFIFNNGMAVEPLSGKKLEKAGIGRILGSSAQCLKMKQKIMQFASNPSPVLIVGESGTEKEEVARAIHEESGRNKSPFIVLNCQAFLEEAFEKELRGAVLKNAKKGKPGKLELADKGTLLLEEIDSLSLSAQAKLMNILVEKQYTRVGGSKQIKTNVKMIVTTTKDLRQRMSEGLFLEALYYNLSVFTFKIPSLRERTEEIQALGRIFLQEEAYKAGKTITCVTPEFWKSLEAYGWPGNIRELRGAVEYAVNGMDISGTVTADLLPEHIGIVPAVEPEETFDLKTIERETIRRALNTYGAENSSRQMIADKLGIGIATLYRKMKQYDL